MCASCASEMKLDKLIAWRGYWMCALCTSEIKLDKEREERQFLGHVLHSVSEINKTKRWLEWGIGYAPCAP